MNYLNGLNHSTYPIITGLECPILYYSDGSWAYGSTYNPTPDISSLSTPHEYIENTIQYYALDGYGMPPIFTIPDNSSPNYVCYMFFGPFVDYVYLEFTGNYHLTFTSVIYDADTSASASISSAFTTSNNYLNVNLQGPNNQLEYTTFSTTLTNNNQSIIFDNTLIKEYVSQHENLGSFIQFGTYRQDYRPTCLKISSDDLSSVAMKVSWSSDQYYGMKDYIDHEISIARQQGVDEGFELGTIYGQQLSSISGDVVDGFTYLGQGFTAIESILNIQILPNITLGLIATIPFSIAIIGLIIKLIKK